MQAIASLYEELSQQHEMGNLHLCTSVSLKSSLTVNFLRLCQNNHRLPAITTMESSLISSSDCELVGRQDFASSRNSKCIMIALSRVLDAVTAEIVKLD